MEYKINDDIIMEKYPHFERMINEAFELKDKVDKLDSFLKSDKIKNIPIIELDLMNEQLVHMGNYLSVLKLRIEHIRINYEK